MNQDEYKRAEELSKRVAKFGKSAPAKKETPKKNSLDFINNLSGFEKKKDKFESKIIIPTKIYERDTPEEIVNKINTLEGAIEYKAISGAPTIIEIIDAIRNLKGNDRIDISNIRNGENLARIASNGFNMNDQRWHGSGTSSTGTVTTISIATANGFSGTVATATTTPVITLTTSLTAGSIPFVGSTNNFTQDNANFFFDNTSKQLRVGLTGAPFNADSRVRLAIVGNVNDYSDAAVQNKNAGDSATGDFFTSADNDSSTLIGHYTDFGITSSGWNPATAGNIKTVSVNAAGTGYSIGNVLTISTGGDGNGQVTVATVNGSGGVTSVTLSNNGTGYVTGSGYATTGGGGSGCTINVLSIIDFTLWTANDGYIYNSGGNFIISTDTNAKVIKFSVGGIGTTNEVGRFTATGLTIGLAGTTLGKLTLSGNTSGTTILQSLAAASGTITVPSATDTLVCKATTDTLTNKRITKRVVTTTQSATPIINTDNTDVAYITGLAQAVTSFTTNLSGTPVNGDTLILDITDNGTGRALTFGASFEASGTVALPTTTVASTKLTIGFRWNIATSKWTCVAVA